MEARTSWAIDRPVNRFGRPYGLLGRLAGRMMAVLNRPAQHQVLALLDVRPGDRILEVGYGPGTLVRLLADRTPAALVAGVDPAPEMRDLASRRTRDLRDRSRGGPAVDLRIGTAAETGFGDAAFDLVVSVNTVALWPDLTTGLDELHRVVRPGGRVVLAWHSRSARSRFARRLGLPDDRLAAIQEGLARHFTRVDRRETPDLVVFVAVR